MRDSSVSYAAGVLTLQWGVGSRDCDMIKPSRLYDTKCDTKSPVVVVVAVVSVRLLAWSQKFKYCNTFGTLLHLSYVLLFNSVVILCYISVKTQWKSYKYFMFILHQQNACLFIMTASCVHSDSLWALLVCKAVSCQISRVTFCFKVFNTLFILYLHCMFNVCYVIIISNLYQPVLKCQKLVW